MFTNMIEKLNVSSVNFEIFDLKLFYERKLKKSTLRQSELIYIIEIGGFISFS